MVAEENVYTWSWNNVSDYGHQRVVYDWQFIDMNSLRLIPTEKHREAYVIMMAADVLVSNRWRAIEVERRDSGLDITNGYEIWQTREI